MSCLRFFWAWWHSQFWFIFSSYSLVQISILELTLRALVHLVSTVGYHRHQKHIFIWGVDWNTWFRTWETSAGKKFHVFVYVNNSFHINNMLSHATKDILPKKKSNSFFFTRLFFDSDTISPSFYWHALTANKKIQRQPKKNKKSKRVN